MEPSRRGAANACRVVRSTPTAPVPARRPREPRAPRRVSQTASTVYTAGRRFGEYSAGRGENTEERSIMATYVLVHGAYQGGWIWKPVADRLRAATGFQIQPP